MKIFAGSMLFALGMLGASSAFASSVISGDTITFTVDDGVESYDEAISSSIKKVYKKGKGTMRLTVKGGTSRAMTVYIQEGVLELVDREALAAYNNFYISSGAQYYLHSAYASGKDYATVCQYIRGMAGDGPDGKGAIRIDATTLARSCFRNEVTLTADASIYCDTDQEVGFATDCTLNLNGHTLTMNGNGKTTFTRPVNNNHPLWVQPGAGGKIVINTPGKPEIGDVVFYGGVDNELVINKATQLNVSSGATFPWTVKTENLEPREETWPWTAIEEGTRYLVGGNTTYLTDGSVRFGKESLTGKGSGLVLCSGAVIRPKGTANEFSSIENGSTPSLMKLMPGSIFTNKSVSTWGKVNRKLAIQNWGDFNQVGSAYLANWNGLGFFGLEAGRLHPVSAGYILGSANSRGLLQQDGGELVYETGVYLSMGGRSDYLMRGGSIAPRSGYSLYLANANDAADSPDDMVSFSMVGPGSPVADFKSSFILNSRTGLVSHVNLNAGRFIPTHLSLGSKSAVSYLNLNGGTFVIPTGGWESLMNEGEVPRWTTIFEKGITLEVNRQDRTFLSSQQLVAGANTPIRGARGRGLLSVSVPADMPLTGYRGIMPAKVVNAEGDVTGFGAQVALDFDVAKGEIKTELIVLCPGCDYTAAPKVIVYGSDFETPYECDVTLTDGDQVPGAFVKTGVGEFVLNTTNNSYAGPYVISNGTLMVNYNGSIPTNSAVFVAGGCFRWDWRDRTIGELGGYGTFFGSRDDRMQMLVVTDKFVADATDLNAGRLLTVDQNSDDGVRYATNDLVAFGANCKVVIKNAEQLDPDVSTFVLLRQQEKINRLPKLETEIPEMRLRLRNNGRELCLKRIEGTSIIIR